MSTTTPANPLYDTVISPEALMDRMRSGQPLALFDCSFDLMQPDAGAQQFHDARLPGAVYMDLNMDLSDKSGTGQALSGGRHPLPRPQRFAATLRAKGMRQGMQVVVYERAGVNFCGRLWWMLRWCGHQPVAVLDGGLQAWQAAGGAVESGPAPMPVAGDFVCPAEGGAMPTLDTIGVRDTLQAGTRLVIDARAAPRYRGEVEPLDPVAGHIPGALNRPFLDNFGANGRYKPASELRAAYLSLLAGREPASAVHQCGSGVSALANLLAMEIAGLGGSALYPGSWSEWCNTPGLPCARG